MVAFTKADKVTTLRKIRFTFNEISKTNLPNLIKEMKNMVAHRKPVIRAEIGIIVKELQKLTRRVGTDLSFKPLLDKLNTELNYWLNLDAEMKKMTAENFKEVKKNALVNLIGRNNVDMGTGRVNTSWKTNPGGKYKYILDFLVQYDAEIKAIAA
ncbi:MAG: hypothetical protein ABH824_00120 [Nanoarchaeota archaeon]|nr:hypothetical protein [Nanoarchaeota archaeon]